MPGRFSPALAGSAAWSECDVESQPIRRRGANTGPGTSGPVPHILTATCERTVLTGRYVSPAAGGYFRGFFDACPEDFQGHAE